LEKIRESLVASLIQKSWGRTLGVRRYGEIIGSAGGIDEFDAQRMRIADCLGVSLQPWEGRLSQSVEVHKTPDWAALAEIAPRLGQEPEILLMEVADQYEISLSLQID